MFGLFTVFFAGVVTFLLSTENLLKLYKYCFSLLAIYLSYVTSPIPVSWAAESIPSLCYNLTVRTFLAAVFFITRNSANEDEGHASFELPVPTSVSDALMLSLFYTCGLVHVQPVVVVAYVAMFQSSLWTCIPLVSEFLKSSWKETRRVQNEYGLSHLLQVECSRLRINTVFRLFWISRAVYDATVNCCNEPVPDVIRYVMSHGTETFTGIVGLTVTVSVICHSVSFYYK